jgi:hypothetical protein
MLRRLLKFTAGLAIGVFVWWWTVPVYLELLAREGVIVRADSRYRDMEMITRGRSLFVRSATGVFPSVTIPGDELTYNVILLFALFAMNPSPLSGRNLRRFAISMLVLLALHPIGLLITVESTYASRVGKWSETQYGNFAANAWLILEMFWRLVGMFGVAFACWWATSGVVPTAPSPREAGRGWPKAG